MTEAIDQAVAERAAHQHGIVAAVHLRALGVPVNARRHRVRVGRWQEIYQGVYRVAGAPVTWRSELLAACWAGGTRAAASHRSAAMLSELPGRSDKLVEITCPHWRRTRHDGLVVHESRALPDRDITVIDGIPVTTVERTIFDLCSMHGPRTIDMAVDNAIRRELTTFDELVAVLRRLGHRGVTGTVLMRSVLAARDPLRAPTASERETLLLHVLRSHGLPEPTCQHEIRDAAGELLGRVDVAYPRHRIAIEYDSYQEHVGKQELVRDSRRRNAITAAGWIVLVATAEDVRLGGGRALINAVRRALAARAGTGVSSA